jgi:prepilin peptidase dependent protein B
MLNAAPHRQRGLSLVELMVGIAVGLFVVAAASMLAVTQLNENRRLLLETQVQQDLRAAMDIVTRELRRSGHWQAAQTGVWTPVDGATANPYTEVALAGDPPAEVTFGYMRRPGEAGRVGDPTYFGFKWEGGVLKTRLAAGGWQELTDPATLRITAFTITAVDTEPQVVACPRLCADNTDDCWPRVRVREYEVDVTGQAVFDAAVQRSLRSTVRLRNDLLDGVDCP